MRIMAIDLGDARTGLAVSDLTGMICGEAWTVEEWNMERLCGTIISEAEKRQVELSCSDCPKIWTEAKAHVRRKAEHFVNCFRGTRIWRLSSGMSAEAASKRIRSFMRTEKRKRSTEKQLMLLQQA